MTLSLLETSAVRIGLSRHERPFGGARSRVGRIVDAMLGRAGSTPLANPALEALRAMAAAVRARPAMPNPLVLANFLAAGWGAAELDTIRSMAKA